MESMYFIFDGVKSSDMGLYNVRIDEGGFIETPYWGGANVDEERLKNRLTPYDYGLDLEPIEFSVQFALLDKDLKPRKWSPQERNKVARWLIGDRERYKAFQTSDDLGKFYYVKCVSGGNLNLMNTEGYTELTFRSNSCYAWSPTYIDNFNLGDNNTTQIIELENRSNVLKYYHPKVEIEFIDTDVQIKNLSDGGRVFELKDLKSNEIVSIDNENQIMISNNPLSNPFSQFNRNWLRLVYGVNRLEVKGRCIIKIKSCFPIAQ